MAEAVIFDLDGILVDTEYYKFKAWHEALRTIGIEMDHDEFLQEWVLKGTSYVEFLKKHGKEGAATEDDLRPVVNEHYVKSIDEEICIMPGVSGTLDRLEGEFPLGVATSSHKLYADRILKKLEIQNSFKATACGSEVENLKPSPDVMLLAAERMKVDANVCVAIDDAPKGIAAAKNAGMRAIAVPTKDTQFGDFGKADIVLPDLDEITVELVRMI